MHDTISESERRTGGERRGEDRRKVSIPVAIERRSGFDRRSGNDRRAQSERGDTAAHDFARLFAAAFA